MTLLFIQGGTASQTWHVFNLYNNSHISDSIKAMAFRLGMTVDLCKVTVGRQSKQSALDYLDD